MTALSAILRGVSEVFTPAKPVSSDAQPKQDYNPDEKIIRSVESPLEEIRKIAPRGCGGELLLQDQVAPPKFHRPESRGMAVIDTRIFALEETIKKPDRSYVRTFRIIDPSEGYGESSKPLPDRVSGRLATCPELLELFELAKNGKAKISGDSLHEGKTLGVIGRQAVYQKCAPPEHFRVPPEGATERKLR